MINDNEDTFSLTTEEPVIEENFPILDEHKVEKELTEEFIKMQENMPAHDVAAQFFKMFYPQYKLLLSGLSNKDARRVAEHVVQWPLEVQNPKFGDIKAEQAFQVGVRLMDCKFIMRAYFEMERQQELLKQKQEAEKGEENTGENNGK